MAGALSTVIIASVLLLMSQSTLADSPHDQIIERRPTQEQRESQKNDAAFKEPTSFPANIRIVRDVPYGSDRQQRFDVYGPMEAKEAPIIFMVHGGAWFLGDKAGGAVVKNKVAYWAPRGFIFISTNYRLLPKIGPIEQAKDVARALAAAQDKAASWGGDRTRFILMGHSAGAHLVALLATAPLISSGIISTPWLGAISLDCPALDVVKIMEAKHARFYDRAFGRDPEYWRSASPFHTVASAGRPILVVCTTRRDGSCSQANRFVVKASSLGMRASVLEQNLSHRNVNLLLGKEQRYTEAVEAFIASLADAVAKWK